MSMWIVLALALSVVIGFFVCAPLFEPALSQGDESLSSSGLVALGDAKERALRALKDLELDHDMGKVSHEDFERSKHELSLEVASILEEIRRHGKR